MSVGLALFHATLPRYPKWAAFLAEHPGSWSKLTQCPTESVYKAGDEEIKMLGILEGLRGGFNSFNQIRDTNGPWYHNMFPVLRRIATLFIVCFLQTTAV